MGFWSFLFELFLQTFINLLTDLLVIIIIIKNKKKNLFFTNIYYVALPC